MTLEAGTQKGLKPPHTHGVTWEAQQTARVGEDVEGLPSRLRSGPACVRHQAREEDAPGCRPASVDVTAGAASVTEGR